MSTYKNYFNKALTESGPDYIASVPNTSGQGGAVGNAPSMYAGGTASGTPGTDTYATGDARIPTSIFGGIVTRNGLRKKVNKRKKKK